MSSSLRGVKYHTKINDESIPQIRLHGLRKMLVWDKIRKTAGLYAMICFHKCETKEAFKVFQGYRSIHT